VKALEGLGAKVVEVELADLELCRLAHAVTILSEMGVAMDPFYEAHRTDFSPEVRLKLAVKKRGKTEWAGLVTGGSSRWGRSFKDENYYETISDSLLEASTHAIEDEGFRKALAGK